MKKAEKLACWLLGWQIRSYREMRTKLPQSAIAERLQMSLDEYRSIEAGEARITIDLLLRLQVALQAPVVEHLWLPLASTVEDASEAAVQEALQIAFDCLHGKEGDHGS